jgi:hypothetical protein
VYGSIDLIMKYPTVILGDIKDISSVESSNHSLDIVFSSGDSLDMGVKSWMQHSSLVLVANHIGDHNTGNARDFYVTRDMQWNQATLMLTAKVEKRDLADVACKSCGYFTNPFKG